MTSNTFHFQIRNSQNYNCDTVDIILLKSLEISFFTTLLKDKKDILEREKNIIKSLE